MGRAVMFKQLRLQLRGRGHLKTDTPCQDATYYDSNGEVQVIALADGAGSARFSGYGAQTVTLKACKHMVENFHQIFSCEDGVKVKLDLIEYLLSELEERKTKVRKKAENSDCKIKDFACTFLMVAVCKNEFILAHIGDGVIGYVKDEELKVASAPDNDEFANVTTFITSTNALSSMRLIKGSLDGISGFILMSDGTENSLFNKQTGDISIACARLIDAVAKFPADRKRKRHNQKPCHKKEIEQLFETKIRENTSDDCSVAILGRRLSNG
jgi:serine/threonine protein phosphatase PrpC